MSVPPPLRWLPGIATRQPRSRGQSLYIRPLIIATEATLEVRAANSYRFMIMTSPVGAYFGDALTGVSLRVEDKYTRAAEIGADR